MTTQRIMRNASVLWPIISTLLLGIADGIPNKFFCTSAECQSTWTPYKNMAAGLRGKCITIPSSIWGRCWKKMTLTQFLLISSYYHGILAATFQTCKKVHIVMEVLSYTTRSGRNRFTINFQYICMTLKSIQALSKNSTKHFGANRF